MSARMRRTNGSKRAQRNALTLAYVAAAAAFCVFLGSDSIQMPRDYSLFAFSLGVILVGVIGVLRETRSMFAEKRQVPVPLWITKDQ